MAENLIRFLRVMASIWLVAAAGCAHVTQNASVARHEVPPAFDVSVANIESRQAAVPICLAAAEAHQANWTGLFWTPIRGGLGICALTPRANGVVVDPIVLADTCLGDPEAFLQCGLIGQTPATMDRVRAAMRERPDMSSPRLRHIEPAESFAVLDFLFVEHFTHRGVLRSAWGEDFPAGQLVFPGWEYRSDDSFPWERRRDGEEGYFEIIAYPQRVIIQVSYDHPGPDIAWERLPPFSNQTETWVLVRTSDGSIGWANDEELHIDYGIGDFDGREH